MTSLDGLSQPDDGLVAGTSPTSDGGVGAPLDAEGPGAPDAAAGTPSAYVRAVLEDSPLAFFRLDEPTGPVAKSLVGSTTGTYLGAFVFGVAGAVGDTNPSVTFDPLSARVQLGDVFAFAGSTPFSLECWIRPTVADNTRFLFDRRTTTGEENGYTLYYGGTYFIFARIRDGEQFMFATLEAPPPIDQWSHVVATFDGTFSRLFLNGTVVAESDNADSMIGGGVGNFAIGDMATGQYNKLAGGLDDVAIYPTALSAARVEAHYRASGR